VVGFPAEPFVFCAWMARICMFLCEQTRQCAREQSPHAFSVMALQGPAGHSNAALSPQSYFPGFASGFLSRKFGCTHKHNTQDTGLAEAEATSYN
jgi:hypothetical protein